MARLNVLNLFGRRTHEGAAARNLSAELQLRRSVLACLLWERQFYEDGVEIAGRIAELVPKVSVDKVAALAVEAREAMKLRHAPLLLVREMARHKTHRALVSETLVRVIQRADELAEFVAIYWKDGRAPLSSQVKKGLAAAFPKFDEYQLAKYNRAGPIKLRDVLFLCHAKPRDQKQAKVWRRLVEGKLTSPDTWEVALSVGADKRKAWERLLREKKLGALALLRNLRNMREAQVDESLVLTALEQVSTARVLPFRFLAAARYAPQWEQALEQAMLKCVAGTEKLPGKTIVLVDVSGSMTAPLSHRSEMQRTDAAYGLAVLLREIAEKVAVYSFSDNLVRVPSRRGFALRDAIDASQPHNGTLLGKAVEELNRTEKRDRLIVISDEQAHDKVVAPKGKGYLINVASYKNGVGYGKWTHIDGWSEAVIHYIHALEQTAWVN
ncbi:MAG: TROVE domain-containing protein [Acidobacteria bacterium]|nr:TROVE domain-containing protein [Acidobacteriota bacterium]MBV9623403.1 TROVE domain-containing protein [Acidobacteriota bacterium]